MKQKKTPWFQPDIKPARLGVYERDDSGSCMYDGEPNFSHWDGKKWGFSGTTPKQAYGNAYGLSCEQKLPWRGLAQKPEGT